MQSLTAPHHENDILADATETECETDVFSDGAETEGIPC